MHGVSPSPGFARGGKLQPPAPPACSQQGPHTLPGRRQDGAEEWPFRTRLNAHPGPRARHLTSPQRGLTPLSRRLPLPLAGPFCSLDASEAPLPYPHLRSHFLLLLLRVLSTRPPPRSLPVLLVPSSAVHPSGVTVSSGPDQLCVSCVRRGSGSTQPSASRASICMTVRLFLGHCLPLCRAVLLPLCLVLLEHRPLSTHSAWPSVCVFVSPKPEEGYCACRRLGKLDRAVVGGGWGSEGSPCQAALWDGQSHRGSRWGQPRGSPCKRHSGKTVALSSCPRAFPVWAP